jgi:hypothetical protein
MHVAYRLHLIEEGTPKVCEQRSFMTMGADGIQKFDLVCSGILPRRELLTHGLYGRGLGETGRSCEIVNFGVSFSVEFASAWVRRPKNIALMLGLWRKERRWLRTSE